MPLAAAVAVDKATPQFDKEYSYRVPEGLPVQPGCRVTVPFGRGDRRRMGVVLSLYEAEDTARLKPVLTLVDREPAARPGADGADRMAAGAHLLQPVRRGAGADPGGAGHGPGRPVFCRSRGPFSRRTAPRRRRGSSRGSGRSPAAPPRSSGRCAAAGSCGST